MSTDLVARFVSATSFQNLSLEIVQLAKLLIRDNLGLLLASSKEVTAGPAVQFARSFGGQEESTIIGTNIMAPCPVAAMTNTAMAKGLGGLEDGEYRSIGFLCHCGGTILATALAVAERQGATCRQLIEGVVVGYEVAMRAGWISRLAGTFPLTETYAAAAVTAKIMDLGIEETVHALGLADAMNISVISVKHHPKERIPSITS